MDITRIVQQTIGQDLFGINVKRMPVPLAIPIAMAASSLASSVIGGFQASKAAKEAERKQRDMEARENAWYLRNYNQNYLDTAAGQNLVRRAKEFAKENWRKAAGAQAVAGGTDAATAMAKEAGNKMMGETLSNVAAADLERKNQVDNIHMKNQQNFGQMDMAREKGRAQNVTNAAQGASNALMAAASAMGGQKTDLQGASNASKPVQGFTQVGDQGKVYSNGSTTVDLTNTDEQLRRQAAQAFRR